MLNQEDLFSFQTVLMAILLSVTGWAGIEIFTIKAAVAAIEAEQPLHNEAAKALGSLNVTLARVEEGQRYLKEAVDTHKFDLREMSLHMRELHSN